jgi:molecular chaperone DnaJ
MANDFYSTLGVARDASAEDIKKAYRKKAMELHPDRNAGDKTKEAEFKRVNEAYAVLSDATKKSRYDQYGSAEGPQGFGGFGWGTQGFGAEFNVGDIFESFFGGGFQWGGSGGSRRREVGGDLEVRLALSFAEAYAGVKKEISFERQTICGDCKGSGARTASDISSCPDCNGSGRVRRRVQTLFGVVEQTTECERCDGTGKIIKQACSTCRGHKFVRSTKTRTIDVPAGIADDMQIKLRDEGHEGRDGAGDLYVQFKVPESDGLLSREEHDLVYSAMLDPVEFILGTKKSLNIPLIGTRELDIKPGTDPGSEFVFAGEWFPDISTRAARRGRLVIRLGLEIPKKLTKKEREYYEAIAQEKKLDTYDSKGFFEKFFD